MSRPDTGEPVLILIADDERAIAVMLAMLIADLGYRPLVARNGQQALELARATWPALVLTDLMMPHLDGAGLIAALRAEAAATGRAPIPAILVTAAGSQRAQAAGADVVLDKPFDLEELGRTIARLLAGASSGE